ncbi:hypothetical protein [Nocardioides marmotae]|uniref:hypothetical protein n=1 Tax=Nocardioides marmotae TaxID=2663857 RepID=UPI0012B59720|nr:hypothetical protein [Nocardioides marmotae]MBC9733121.1 hypothetical protein [Nocardioides marmotae]MTB84235.1 hypothetical protein [Nocardioides marmotae]
MSMRSDERVEVTEFAIAAPVVEGATVSLRYAARAGERTVEELTEVVELPGTLDHVDPRVRDQVLRLLALAASLSYFKAFAPVPMAVPGGLTARERRFLEELTRHGLGEFAYVNQMPEVFATTVHADELPEPAAPAPAPDADPQRLLVAVGGGKDSIVSIEAVRGAGFDVGLFSVNSYTPITDTAAVAGIDLHSARRRLDPTLFRLNEAGAPNGHVPVTAVNSLVAVLTALALGYDTVVFSNEASSSFGNVDWHGRTINHQWSKSLEFERLLRASLPAGAPTYVSLLRPVTELRIARRFADHTAYHRVFTSCNRAFKLREGDRTTWCADCPKCRFVFLCLAPFLPREALLAIFGGRDMFADENQLTGFLELLGAEGLLKPFECVGEPDECRVAVALLREHPEWRDHPFLARPELAEVTATPAEREGVFAFREGEHLLPPALETVARAV